MSLFHCFYAQLAIQSVTLLESRCVLGQEKRNVVISMMKRINVYLHVIKLELTSPVQVYTGAVLYCVVVSYCIWLKGFSYRGSYFTLYSQGILTRMGHDHAPHYSAFPCYETEDCSGPVNMSVYSGRHCCAQTIFGHSFHNGTKCYTCIGM